MIDTTTHAAPPTRNDPEDQRILGDMARLEAEIVERGGRSTFSALFDLDGNLVAAKIISSRHGLAWAILASDDPTSEAIAWFNPSRARTRAARTKANAAGPKGGYYIGRVAAPAKVVIAGGEGGDKRTRYAAVVRADGGFSRDVEVLNSAP